VTDRRVAFALDAMIRVLDQDPRDQATRTNLDAASGRPRTRIFRDSPIEWDRWCPPNSAGPRHGGR
jgi:hypothetical protein